jgi:hypothetical protein
VQAAGLYDRAVANIRAENELSAGENRRRARPEEGKRQDQKRQT